MDGSSFSKILDCPLVATALLGADVLDMLLSQLATLALGAVWLGLLLVDVVVLSAAGLDVDWCLVVAELRVAADLLCSRRVVVVNLEVPGHLAVVELAAVHLVNVDLSTPLVHDGVVLVASLLCRHVLVLGVACHC